jgi:hypothetical protein
MEPTQTENESLIAELFPGLPAERRKEADEVLRRYFALIFRLYNRLSEEGNLSALTEEAELPRIEAGRTFTNQYEDTGL